MTNEQKSWRELRDAFFNYTRAERNGILVLAGLIVLLCCYNFYCKYLRVVEYDYSEVIAEINSAYQDMPAEEEASPLLFSFNPNTVTKDEMLRLGFKEKAIKTFLKYRSTGAKFNNLQDFEKVYSIDSSDVARVKDYIFFEEKKTKTGVRKTKVKREKKTADVPAPTLFDFDPNTASEQDLKKLGLSPKVIKTIIKFRKRGGFRKSEDLAKIYGLDKRKYEKLFPFIKIAKKESSLQNKLNNQVVSTLGGFNGRNIKAKNWVDTVAHKSIDINNATDEEWQRIDGIGPTYAKMINNYRRKLGGFYTVSQISETYGLPDSVYQKVVPFVKKSKPKNKIQINFVQTDSLARHPYLTWKQANVITNYRAKHGPYNSAREVAKVKIFTKEKWERIVPYLDYRTAVDTFDHSAY